MDEEIIILSDDEENFNNNENAVSHHKMTVDGKNNGNIEELQFKSDQQHLDDFPEPVDELYFGIDDLNDGLIFDLEQEGQQQPTTSQNLNIEIVEKPKKIKRVNKPDDETGNGMNLGGEIPIPTKRKKRTKEEIERDKFDKQVNKIRREILSSKNSKCEKYLFCHCSTRIFQIDDQINEELRKRFEERGIPNQFIHDSSPAQIMRIIWKRKRIDPSMEDGKVISKERMEVQNCFFSVVSGDTFTQLAKTKNGILDYIKEQITVNKMKGARLTLVILGKHTIRENTVDSLIFEAYERFGAQFRFIRDALDFSFIVVQMHRSLAKFEKKAEKLIEVEDAGTFILEKGISDGPGMVIDWWTKMLDHIHRMSEDQKRAIVQMHPNPIKLMDRLLDPTNSPGNSMFILSEIQMDNGRRLGPVLAQKIFRMLTSLEGNEIIDSGSGE